jgi:alpha-L-rhamnosidase
MTPDHLRCEYLANPRGIDAPRPRLSWILRPDVPMRRGETQTAYRIIVASTEELLARDTGDLWDSGKVASAQSIQVEYAGTPLASLLLCHWKVRIWDGEGQPSAWSGVATWRMGIVSKEDWRAQWILCPAEGADGGAATGLCPWFRKTFVLENVPATAVACVGSIGYHELYINGRKVGDEVLAPSVSDLRKRALYLTHEIAPYLRVGKNAVGIWLAPGWSIFQDANPPVDFQLKQKPLCLAQLDFGPGSAPIVTDASWRCAPSNTRHLGRWQNSDFGGDRVDATMMETVGWNEAEFDDRAWQAAVIVPEPVAALSPDLIEPNRLCEKIAATGMARVAGGKYRFVLARLFTGWIEMKVKGRPGTKVTIRVSSLAEEEVEYNQQNEYIIGPAGEGVFRNRFSYHECGFVTVEGLAAEPEQADLVGYRVTNDRERTGDFDCSNPLLKQIYDITVNTYVNLSTGGMTVDCPHRERLGYGGDGHTSMELALDTVASAAFLTKWAQDWCDIQEEDGRINHTAPTYGGGGGPAWSGFIVAMPWEVYLSHGDERILERTYPFAKKWLAYMAEHVGLDGLLAPVKAPHWNYMNGGEWLFLGDWLSPSGDEASATPEALLFNNCYYLYLLGLTARIAKIIGRPEAGNEFSARAGKIREAIQRRFFNADTHAYLDTKQTHCVMPLLAGTVPAESVKAVEKNLEEEILVACRGHLDTGMHGTYFMTKYLTEHDRSDLIFAYASQTTHPSYGDLIAKGYETWPESWGGCPSRLHGCLNGIGAWFQRGLAGIRPDPAAPGYKKIILRPAPVGDVTWVAAHHDSPYGRIISRWKREAGAFALEVTIPPNTTATVYVPMGKGEAVQESGQPAEKADGVRFLREESGTAVFEVGSGSYRFGSRL